MGTYQLSLHFAILTACLVVGSVCVYSVVSRIRSHRRYFEQLRRQSFETVSLQEEERQRIAFDLHDGLAPLLALIRLQLRKGSRDLNREKLTEAEENIVRAIGELRSIVGNLTPRNLQERGLKAVLDDLFRQCQDLYPVSVEFWYHVGNALPDRMTIHLYRLVQEVVHNAVTHSGASFLQVHFTQLRQMLYIVCQDNGRGFHPKEIKGMGRNSLQLRTVILQGRLRFYSSPGKGTIYSFTIPLSSNHETHYRRYR